MGMAELGKYYGRPVRAVYIGTGGTPIEYVPVVRCKDCKHKRWSGLGEHFCVKHHMWFENEDHFCSNGERREGE